MNHSIRGRNIWGSFLVLLGCIAALVGCGSSQSVLPTSTVVVATEVGATATATPPSLSSPTESIATETVTSPTATMTVASTVRPSASMTPSTTPSIDPSPTTSPTSAPATATPPPSLPTATVVVATATTEQTDTTEQAEVVLFYQRTGGIAGVNQSWTIYSDGTIVGNDGNTRQASVEEVVKLLTDIEELGFFDMAARYGDPRACCDRFTHLISVRGSRGEHSVTTVDGAEDAPAELGEVLSRVSHFVIGDA